MLTRTDRARIQLRSKLTTCLSGPFLAAGTLTGVWWLFLPEFIGLVIVAACLVLVSLGRWSAFLESLGEIGWAGDE